MASARLLLQREHVFNSILVVESSTSEASRNAAQWKNWKNAHTILEKLFEQERLLQAMHSFYEIPCVICGTQRSPPLDPRWNFERVFSCICLILPFWSS